jgi:protein SCO1/2
LENKLNDKDMTGLNTLRIILLCLAIVPNAGAQNMQGPSVNPDTEIGIFEQLGDTLPLDLKFQNEQDSTVVLGDLIDKPTVLSFVYFDCPGICSPLLVGVSDVIEKMDLELGKDYQVITISFNYRDTPAKAREKKKNFLNKHSEKVPGAWKYLTGDSASIYTITNAAGFKFKQVGFDYIHAGAILVVSPKGKITRYLYGITFLPLDLKMAIIESGKGLARPASSRILEYCYSYDPSGKRYVMDVLKVTGSLMLFILLIFAVFIFIRYKRKK